MRENERKRRKKKSGGDESFRPILLMSKNFPLVTVHRSLYIAPAKQNYKKNQNQKLLQGIKWEENKKKKIKSKNEQQEGTGQDEQWQEL